MRLLKDKSEKEVYLKIWTHPVFDNKGEVEMVVEYAKFEETPRVVSDIDPGKEEVPREFFNNMNNILAGILGNAELIMFKVKRYQDLVYTIIWEHIKLIEDLVIAGSKLIRDVKGEVEKIPEKKQIVKMESKVEEEKKVDKIRSMLVAQDVPFEDYPNEISMHLFPSSSFGAHNSKFTTKASRFTTKASRYPGDRENSVKNLPPVIGKAYWPPEP